MRNLSQTIHKFCFIIFVFKIVYPSLVGFVKFVDMKIVSFFSINANRKYLLYSI